MAWRCHDSLAIRWSSVKNDLNRDIRRSLQLNDLPQCNDCRSLFDSLDAHNVWKGGGHDQSKRVFLKQQAHIFKPKKKDGQPSTNWIFLEEKLNIQQRIRSKFSKGLQSSTGYDSSPEDYLEGFFWRDHSRHEAGKRKSRSSLTSPNTDRKSCVRWCKKLYIT